MRNTILRITALILSIACLMCFVACDNIEQTDIHLVDGNALFQALLENVSFETEMKDTSEYSELYFLNLPDSAQVRFYSGSAYYADCLAIITVANANDRDVALKSLYSYVDEMTVHFQSYHPEQVPKCNKAVL